MMKRKQSEIYAKILKAFMVGTLACGLVGCAASDNEPKAEKEENTEKQQETKNVIPTEIMSKEETMELTEGTTIELKDLEMLPNEAILEEQNCTTLYVIEVSLLDSSNNVKESLTTKMGVLPDFIGKNGVGEQEIDSNIQRYQVLGIEIMEISGFSQSEDGTWYKTYNLNGTDSYASPVISEKLLEGFREPQ